MHAVNESFPTVLTSGAIMTMAGLVIAFRVSDVYIGHIGLAVGRGALISVVLVLTVLPQLIVLFDKAIAKTTFGKKRRDGAEAGEREDSPEASDEVSQGSDEVCVPQAEEAHEGKEAEAPCV